MDYSSILPSDFPNPSEHDLDGPHEHEHDDQPPLPPDTDTHTPHALEYAQEPIHPPLEREELAAMAGEMDSGEALGGGQGRGGEGLSAQEKKERQKEQNRRAAERSRGKRREELVALEATLNGLQSENAHLRQRLASFHASGPSSQLTPSASLAHSTPPPPILSSSALPHTTASQLQLDATTLSPTGIDYAYLARIQKELSQARSALLERELELAASAEAKGEGEGGEEAKVLRQVILEHDNRLSVMRAERESLDGMAKHLRKQREELARKGDEVRREVVRRKGGEAAEGDVRMVEEDGGVGGAEEEGMEVNREEGGVERALLDIGGWVDEAVKNWEETSALPGSSREDGVVGSS